MNILFFLTPKKEVAYLYDTDSLFQALEKMENHRYAAIPIIGRTDGRYMGTLTEGDLLWDIRIRSNFSIKEAEAVSIMEIERKRDNEPVVADADMEDLINKIMIQNFVPVIDDANCFIGIITRKDVIEYLINQKIILKNLPL